MPRKKFEKVFCDKIDQEIKIKYEAVRVSGDNGDFEYKKMQYVCPNEECNEQTCPAEEAPIFIK